MIQNARQYQIAQTKLRDLLLDLAALDLPDADLRPRQILARQNSLRSKKWKPWKLNGNITTFFALLRKLVPE